MKFSPVAIVKSLRTISTFRSGGESNTTQSNDDQARITEAAVDVATWQAGLVLTEARSEEIKRIEEENSHLVSNLVEGAKAKETLLAENQSIADELATVTAEKQTLEDNLEEAKATESLQEEIDRMARRIVSGFRQRRLNQPEVAHLFPDNYWDFRNKVGKSEIKDNHSDVTATLHGGGELTAEGAKFDGKSGYTALSPLETGGTTSFEFYAWLDSFTHHGRILDFCNGAHNENIILFTGLSNTGVPSKIGWQTRQGSEDKGLYTSNFDLSAWTHVVATVSGNTMKLYKNGVLVGTNCNGWEPKVMTRKYNIIGAANWNGMLEYFHGTIAYLKMWHGVELQQAAVSALYQNRSEVSKNDLSSSEVEDLGQKVAAVEMGGVAQKSTLRPAESTSFSAANKNK